MRGEPANDRAAPSRVGWCSARSVEFSGIEYDHGLARGHRELMHSRMKRLLAMMAEFL